MQKRTKRKLSLWDWCCGVIAVVILYFVFNVFVATFLNWVWKLFHG